VPRPTGNSGVRLPGGPSGVNPMPTTTYRVRDDRGIETTTTDTELAARLSRAGLTVSAMTEGDR